MMEDHVKITGSRIDPAEVVSRLVRPEIGAVATFVGVVRADAGVSHLEYEAYPGMVEEALQGIIAEVKERWPGIRGAAIVHRTGRLEIGEIAVVIGLAASHREGIFDALRYAIDRLKRIAPIWKKELGKDGGRWITEA